MGGGRESFEVVAHALVEHFVFREQCGKLGELRGGGKFAVDEQVSGLDEGAFLRELGDVVAAVLEDAFFAVDEGDRALAGTGVSVARVERDAAGFCAKRADVDSDFSFRSNDGGQHERLAIND